MAASLNQMNNNNNTYLPAAPLSLITMETWQLQLHNLPIMVNVISLLRGNNNSNISERLFTDLMSSQQHE